MLIVRYHDIYGKHLGDIHKGNFQMREAIEAITNPYKSPIFANMAVKAFIFDEEDGETLVSANRGKSGKWLVTEHVIWASRS